MRTEILEQIGLSKNEIKVYLNPNFTFNVIIQKRKGNKLIYIFII